MSENERDEAPAVPATAEPEEPQTSIHEPPVQPDGDEEPDGDGATP